MYDITQALHDAEGHLIGAAGMDLLEARIPSAAALLEPAARGR